MLLGFGVLIEQNIVALEHEYQRFPPFLVGRNDIKTPTILV
jgi:hypothetical protein